MDFAALIAARRSALAALTAQRTALGEEATSLLAQVETEGRSALTETEEARHLEIIGQRAALQEQIEAAQAGVDQLVRDQEADAQNTRDAATRTPVVPVPAARVGSEPETYRRGGNNSYFRDLAMVNRSGDPAALARLARNNEERAGGTTVDNAGGEFVPPGWMIADYVKKARAGRVVADQLEHHDLPAGIGSIDLPTITTGTSVAEQSTQNTALSDTDMVTSSVSAGVATIGGKSLISLQLIEQSPINIDEVVFADLTAAHAAAVDVFCISNNATGKYGLLNVSGLNAVTYTDATPTVPEFLPKVIDGATKIHTNRLAPAEKVFMTPAMWGWLLAAQDSTNRPLVVPAAMGPQNAFATSEGAVAEGLAGFISSMSLPVFIDANLPSNLGTGTNESHVIVARTSDIHLYETALQAQAFFETKADTLSVVFRLYNYIALQSARYAKSISKISGTGTIVPAL
ncbi:MAG: phage major capsid protein [Planctomycetaceae bacterium]|nr:phage major capsid protein [Planctomycetaceae bacterium]